MLNFQVQLVKLNVFANFRNIAENEFNRKIKTLGSGNRTGCCNTDFVLRTHHKKNLPSGRADQENPF